MGTGNPDKFMEAKAILSEFGVDLRLIEVERVEIQANDLETIAIFSVKRIESDMKPIVVEDAGLFIEHFKGFPGPYSSYILETVGLEGILRLMKGLDDREASFRSAVAYRCGSEIRCFTGFVNGTISQSIRGTQGFGYDPIFIPHEGDGRTLGEMMADEKNKLSHRARAFRSLGEWLVPAG